MQQNHCKAKCVTEQRTVINTEISMNQLQALRESIFVDFSVWEIIGQSDGGLSVLRTFRLLRVLKLVRFLPALRRQLVVLMKTMDNVATFCMLLMLFIFTFRYTCSLTTLTFKAFAITG